MKRILTIAISILLMFSLVACGATGSQGPQGDQGIQGEQGIQGDPGKDGKDGKDGIDGADGKDGKDGEDGKTPYIQNGYWYINGVNTGVRAEGINNKDDFTSKNIGNHYMISNGLTDMAANAVEFIADDNTGIVYAAYLASETSLGESSSLVKLAKFNIMQPTNITWVTAFDKSVDFNGDSLSECNIIDLNNNTVRVYAINKRTWTYYYKDVNKRTLAISDMKEAKFKPNEGATAISFSKNNLNSHIASIGGVAFSEVQMTTKILEVNGYYYATIVGGNGTKNVLFVKSADGATWEFQSVIKHNANYEAMLEYHNGRFWVMCRNGSQTATSNTYQNLMYSEDGINWTQSNLALTTSDTRPYLFTFQGDLYLAYSSPMPKDYSTVRTWRCNIHIGKIISSNSNESFEEIVYKESKFGIVYYALCDWYGNMVMLYSSGELNPTEGLMGGWSQGKDCVNYTIIHQQEPTLSFDNPLKTLSSIHVASKPYITQYAVGESFDASGMIVKATYSDGSYANITGYTLSTPDMTAPGTKTITVTYSENGVSKTTSFDIEVYGEEETGYTQLESIRSNGHQYIDTGYKTTSTTKIVVTMEKPDDSGVNGGKWLFNSTSASGSRNYGLCFKPGGAYVLDYGGTRYTEGTVNWKEGKNIITVGNGEITINDGPLATGLNVTTTASNSQGTLKFYTSASTSFNVYLAAVVYDISVYEGDTLVMQLVPVQRNRDEKIGFYDLVNEKYVFSSTTSDFELNDLSLN